ncbi:MAG TPA: sigma-54-dependent Fis family transcriptional regulator [Acidobacteria bacterium]|jgi:two-component system response regulator PilR (NtrC family)|nr:sigma-54-dependent Fis family transcriptional regulator [Acidobacteriota bacterium]
MAIDTTTETKTTTGTILVVDDERSMREFLSIMLKKEGHDVVVADCGRAAVKILERRPVDLLISDIKMPDMSGVDVLRRAKEIRQDIVGIMITAFKSTESAVEALRLGAHDYLEKPFDNELLKKKVRDALEQRRVPEYTILGDSPQITEVRERITRVAPTNSTILITGESGTGKELVARAIHSQSKRSARPFVPLNCGALPETLLESELFGHEKGAFTSADSTKKGLVEAAERGSIFLDEIGEMSLMMQVKLLRFLQERRFRRVGGTEEKDVDVRVIAATNQDLAKMVETGDFRRDLFYRVNVIKVDVPPLRERKEDILPLAQHFIDKFNRQMGKELQGLAPSARRTLESYTWRGNIRELENVIERAVALEDNDMVQAESLDLGDIPGQDRRFPQHTVREPSAAIGGASARLPESGFMLEQHVQNIEREYLAQALQQAGGVKVRAAGLLGMSFRSFRYYLKKYHLS